MVPALGLEVDLDLVVALVAAISRFDRRQGKTRHLGLHGLHEGAPHRRHQVERQHVFQQDVAVALETFNVFLGADGGPIHHGFSWHDRLHDVLQVQIR